MICQFNISWMRRPYFDPSWDIWKNVLVPALHARAREAPGFLSVWDGTETPEGYLAPYPSEPLVMGNLSAWESLSALRVFVHEDPVHRAVMRRSAQWFLPPQKSPWSVIYESNTLDLEEAVTFMNWRTLACAILSTTN